MLTAARNAPVPLVYLDSMSRRFDLANGTAFTAAIDHLAATFKEGG